MKRLPKTVKLDPDIILILDNAQDFIFTKQNNRKFRSQGDLIESLIQYALDEGLIKHKEKEQ